MIYAPVGNGDVYDRADTSPSIAGGGEGEPVVHAVSTKSSILKLGVAPFPSSL